MTNDFNGFTPGFDPGEVMIKIGGKTAKLSEIPLEAILLATTGIDKLPPEIQSVILAPALEFLQQATNSMI